MLADGAWQTDVLLAPYSKLRIGGPAAFLVEPATVEDWVIALARADEMGLPVFHIGRGSNSLFPAKGLPGLVISLRRLDPHARPVGDGELVAGAGCLMPKVAMTAARCGLTGFTFLTGIPGTIGAGVAINAGTGGMNGPAIDSVLVDCTLLDARTRTTETVDARSLGLRYRSSEVLHSKLFVAQVRLRGTGESTAEEIHHEHRKHLRDRASRQPLDELTCGSVFKHVEGGHAAGWYIERAGGQRFAVGGAAVSAKHANWIVNDGSASDHDVRELIEMICERVDNEFGVQLEREVVFFPEDSSST